MRSSTTRSGISGCAARIWIATNTASSTAPAARNAIVVEDPQLWFWAYAKPYTSANRPAVAVSVPGTSIGSRAERTSRRSSATAPTAATIAKPRLTNIVQRHDRSWVSTPPSSSPIAAPAPPIAPQIPNAVARSRGSVNVVLTRESAAGAISAANTPCSPRAATSIAEALRRAADYRRGGESDRAGDKQPLAAEQIAEPPTGEQQAAERQRVRGHDPLAAVVGEMQRLLCRGQRDVDHRNVEHDHQLRDPEDREDPPAARAERRPRPRSHVIALCAT